MAVIRNVNAQVLIAPAAIFNADIQTEAVQMNNAQAAHFIVTSGAGDATEVTGQVMARRAEREDFHVREFTVTVGGNAMSKIMVAAREIASDDGTSVYLRIPNAEREGVQGAILVVKTNERYSSDGNE